MTIPVVHQPNIGRCLNDQTSNYLTLFNTILETTHLQDELNRSWEITSQDIIIREQWDDQQSLDVNQTPS